MRTDDKVLDASALIESLEAPRGAGKTVALTNGLFDILHVGHLSYLEAASRESLTSLAEGAG